MRLSNDRSDGVICMSAIAGMAVSFAWPWALAALPLALGALVYLFRARGTTQSKVVSSLLLLSQLPQYLPSRRRFVPPLQFWLELVLAVALALGASGITVARTGERVAVVVDTSKSMGALVSADETRLQSAVRIASADIAQAPADTLFTVLRAGSSVTARSGGDSTTAVITKGAALAELKALEPTYEVDSLANVVAELRARGEYDSIWLYTDRSIEGSGHDSRLRVTTVPYDPEVARNIWISSIQSRLPSDGGEGTTHRRLLEVGVSRVGVGEEEVSVTAACTDRQSSATVSLPAVTPRLSGRASSLVQLGPVSAPWSFCRVSVSAESDLLPADNEAWIVHTGEPGALGVVSSLSPHVLGLDRLPFGAAVVVAGADVSKEMGLRGVLYHRMAPATLPHIPTLVVYPEVGTKLWGGLVQGDAARGSGGAVEITRWDESHPIVKYVRPGLLALPTARVLECPGSARPILNGAGGALVCAGEEGERRYAIFGFELFPFDGMRTPTLSIMTLNTLQWLYADSRGADGVVVGTGLVDLPAVDGDSERQVQLIAPREQQLAVGQVRRVEVSEPGVIVVSERGSTMSQEQLIAINAISDQESDLTIDTPISIASNGVGVPRGGSRGIGYDADEIARTARQHELHARSEEASRVTSYYERIFTWCALVIVVLDLVRRVIARRGWRERA